MYTLYALMFFETLKNFFHISDIKKIKTTLHSQSTVPIQRNYNVLLYNTDIEIYRL